MVQSWRPSFTIITTHTPKIVAGVWILGLSIELFKTRFLYRVGSRLGTMLKIDKLTSIQYHGRFVRICVKIVFGRMLVSQINALGHILKLEYKGLHTICFKCGKYGHKQDSCTDPMVGD
uniref:CCHC-type domain-containing protein n=1 Tax=Cajanus cajan TaxID=3821 RepID=A0A151QSP0_CAJCA|nr:hypothetical protein KK1_045826 [Cajanus cajan]